MLTDTFPLKEKTYDGDTPPDQHAVDTVSQVRPENM